MKIRPILAPTDVSEPSKQAIASAFELAQTFGATLILLHVVEELPPYSGFIPSAGTTKAIQELADRARLDPARLLPKAQDGKVEVICQAVVGAQCPPPTLHDDRSRVSPASARHRGGSGCPNRSPHRGCLQAHAGAPVFECARDETTPSGRTHGRGGRGRPRGLTPSSTARSALPKRSR